MALQINTTENNSRNTNTPVIVLSIGGDLMANARNFLYKEEAPSIEINISAGNVVTEIKNAGSDIPQLLVAHISPNQIARLEELFQMVLEKIEGNSAHIILEDLSELSITRNALIASFLTAVYRVNRLKQLYVQDLVTPIATIASRTLREMASE